MKPILSTLVFLCFAVMFCIALVTTKRSDRRDRKGLEDEKDV